MHRRHLRHIFKAAKPTLRPSAPPPDQATSFLRIRTAEGIEAHPVEVIVETAPALVLAEAPIVEGSRADIGDPVAAAPELLPASLKMRAQVVQRRKQAQV